MDKNFSPSPSTYFTEVVRILKNRSPAIRNEDDLLAIHNLINPTLSTSDIVWAANTLWSRLYMRMRGEWHVSREEREW